MHHLLPYLVAMLLACSTAVAAEAPVNDAPASDAHVNKDLATPKAAALMFVRAMEKDDMTAFRAVTVGTDEEYRLFEPLVGMVGAAKQLEKAAREKFGKQGSGIVRQSPALGIEVHVQESDVRVNGQTATLRHRGDEPSEALTLRQTSEGWKVDLTAIKNRQKMTDAAAAMQKMREALLLCAADIRGGKYSAADQAERAVAGRIAAAAR